MMPMPHDLAHLTVEARHAILHLMVKMGSVGGEFINPL
jgi:hypothetical protein